MKILVTGGAGYIGSHTCKALATAGYEPIAYDDLSYGHRGAVKWGPLELGSISDHDRLNIVFKKYNISAVIHFAASAYVGESMHDPMKYFMNNAVGTTVLLNTMLANGLSRFVFSSSCATYGIPKSVPITESCTTTPVNPYGQTKLFTEQTLKWLGVLKSLRWVALRYFNAAGADPDCQIGEAHEPETHLIPLVLKAASRGDFVLQVYGDDYGTPDGTAIRDYVHVTDLAAAHVRALQLIETEDVNDFFNLGTGVGVSVKNIIAAVERITGNRVRYEIAERRPGDPPELVACADKAYQKFGWRPHSSDINQIIRDAWAWHTSAHQFF